VITSHFWSQFSWLFVEGLGIVALSKIRLAFIILMIGMFVSLAQQKPFERMLWKRYYLLVFTQSLFYPVIIAIGVLYRVSSNPTQPLPQVNPFANLTLDVIFGLSLVSGIFWVCRMTGLRWVAFCLVVLQEILVLGALFVAGMSITGDWL
jgi:hypothetical protein